MLFLLVAVALAITHTSDPGTWQWLADDSQTDVLSSTAAAADDNRPSHESPETKRGPTDEEPEETDAARKQFQALSDRSTLGAEEMPAYWRFMKWSANQTFDQMRRRARRDVLYTQLWEQPEKYRGKLIALRLHLRRAVKWDAPANSAGVKTVYEAWGATDESASLPYLVVFSELPPGMPLGSNIWEEATFVGYFLKTMAYEAFDKQRAAPLLVGRIQWDGRRSPAARGANESSSFWLTLLVGVLVLAVVIGAWIYRRRAPRPSDRKPPVFAEGGDLDDWLHRVQQAASGEGPERAQEDDAPEDILPRP